MTFARLTRGDWVAAVAALALLLVMSLDWYSTEIGEQARRDAEQADTSGAESGQPGRQIKEDAEIIRSRHEKTAWQAGAFADRLILFTLLAAIILALATAWLRAAGKRFDPPWTPSAITTGVGMAGLILLAARIVQKPGTDAGAVVKLGAPLGIVCIGAIAIGSRVAWNAERDGSAWAEQPADDSEGEGEDTAEREAIQRPAPLFDHEESAGDRATATAVAAPPEQPSTTIEPDPVDQAPPEPPDDSAERERRRAEREQRRSGGRLFKRGRRR